MSDLTVCPNTVAASSREEMDALIVQALDGCDPNRLAMMLGFTLIDPERTAKLAQFDLDMRRLERST